MSRDKAYATLLVPGNTLRLLLIVHPATSVYWRTGMNRDGRYFSSDQVG